MAVAAAQACACKQMDVLSAYDLKQKLLYWLASNALQCMREHCSYIRADSRLLKNCNDNPDNGNYSVQYFLITN